MPFYSVLDVTPTADAWIPSYLSEVGPLVDRHGGRYLARTASHERLEGDRDVPALRILLEWPSRDAAHAFMADPDYAGHLAARQAGSVSHHALIEGKDDMA
ncbi:MAG: DUF1330 domain-containing protein [Pseudomonadota bacterium]